MLNISFNAAGSVTGNGMHVMELHIYDLFIYVFHHSSSYYY